MSPQRRKFTGNEELDTKKMRISDMIYWNPKNETGIKKKDSDSVSTVSVQRAIAQAATSTQEAKQPTIAAPQVKIGPDGKLIIDEASLVVQESERKDTNAWDIVEEDRLGNKVTSLSFRKRLLRTGKSWNAKETDLFYEILRHTGPDFSLMHEYFPTRARHELKTKYNKEEKNNWARLNEVLKKPALLDDKLREYTDRIMQEIEDDQKARKEERKPIRERKVKPIKNSQTQEEKKPAFEVVERNEDEVQVLELEDPGHTVEEEVPLPPCIQPPIRRYASSSASSTVSVGSAASAPRYAQLKPVNVPAELNSEEDEDEEMRRLRQL